MYTGVSREVLWVLKHPARVHPKKKEEKGRKGRKERKKERKEGEGKKKADYDSEKYLSDSTPLNGFRVFRNRPYYRYYVRHAKICPNNFKCVCV